MDSYEEDIYTEIEALEENDGILETEIYIEERNCFNSEETSLVNEALKEIGFPFLSEKFIDEEIDFVAFKNLNTIHISNLLKDFKIGLAVKFEMRYVEWKSNQKTFKGSKTEIEPGIVKRILNSSDEGKNLLQKANPSEKFDRATEKTLSSFICSSFFSKREYLNIHEMLAIADDIQRTFPKELASIYVRVDGKKSSGVLYDRYNNMLRSLRQNDLMPKKNMKRKVQSVKEVEKRLQIFSPEEIRSHEFIKYTVANIDHDLLITHWQKSTFPRVNFIKENAESKISSIYRALLRPDGYQLVSIDFNNLYPNRNFKQLWIDTEPKLKEYLLKNVYQSSLISQIETLDNMTSNKSTAVLMMGIHNILFGDRVSAVYKPTVYDSFCFMLLIINDQNSFDEEFNNWKSGIEEKKLKHQCSIVGFGSLKNLQDKFVVVVEDIKYIFEGNHSLLNAIECVLQIYHVFNLSYPLLNSSVYSFLSSKYLTINDEKSHSSKVLRLISALE